MTYRSVVGETVSETIIEKSRFLAYICHTAGEEAAKAFLADVRRRHPLATHVCFGYIADKIGNVQRFSDDGEPQGTAGMPILGVLKAKQLRETTIAVVRYFGGIKLGAGGLTRAYAGCAAEGADLAETRSYSTGVELALEVDYADVNAAIKFLEKENVLSREFGTCARFVVIVKEEEEAEFIARVSDCLNGRLHIFRGKKYDFPF